MGEACFGFFLLNANFGRVLEFSYFGWENYHHPLEKEKKSCRVCVPPNCLDICWNSNESFMLWHIPSKDCWLPLKLTNNYGLLKACLMSTLRKFSQNVYRFSFQNYSASQPQRKCLGRIVSKIFCDLSISNLKISLAQTTKIFIFFNFNLVSLGY